ncbi:hypothetical protein ACRQV7_06150 [Caproiciproducens sp. R2]|uniref:hypothetical protein n=1 Tax=Caproiciproducens sp. R2 TaxID=3435187 RepID=UPI00403367D2
MLTKKVKNVLSPALIVIQYLIFMGCCLAYEKQQGLLIRLPEITALNIGKRALHDSISLFPVIVLLIITLFKDKSLNNLGITLKRPLLIIALFSIYLIMFFLNGDFSMKGYYSAFFLFDYCRIFGGINFQRIFIFENRGGNGILDSRNYKRCPFRCSTFVGASYSV